MRLRFNTSTVVSKPVKKMNLSNGVVLQIAHLTLLFMELPKYSNDRCPGMIKCGHTIRRIVLAPQ